MSENKGSAELAKKIWDDIDENVLNIPNDHYLLVTDSQAVERIADVLHKHQESNALRKQDANMEMLMKLSVTAANLRKWDDRATVVFGEYSELTKALLGHSGAIQEAIEVIGQILKEPE